MKNMLDYIDGYLRECQTQITTRILIWIQGAADEINGQGFRKVWDRGTCDHDYSGVVYDDYEHHYPPITTVEELREQLTGESEATYCSGQGLRWKRYDKEIYDYIIGIYEQYAEQAEEAYLAAGGIVADSDKDNKYELIRDWADTSYDDYKGETLEWIKDLLQSLQDTRIWYIDDQKRSAELNGISVIEVSREEFARDGIYCAKTEDCFFSLGDAKAEYIRRHPNVSKIVVMQTLVGEENQVIDLVAERREQYLQESGFTKR